MFKVAGPMWAQATGGENVFAKLVKAGKKVLRRVLQKQKEIEPATAERIFKPTWSLRAQQVQVGESSSGRLIGGLFPKQILKTHAAEVRRQAALRLIRDAKKVPVFAFVGLTLGASLDQKKHGGDDVLFSGIRDLFQQYGTKESCVGDTDQQFSLETLQLGKLIGKGCNAAVFEARPCETALEETEAEPVRSDDEQNVKAESMVAVSEEQIPPHIFHTDDHSTFMDESEDDDDDFSIISEDDKEGLGAPAEDTTPVSLDGWVLYRVSTAPNKTAVADSDDQSDSESDIFILAGDEEGLESMPDLGEMDMGWSMIGAASPDRQVTDLIGQKISQSTDNSENSAMSTPVSSQPTSSDRSFSNADLTTSDPEPAPNISGSEDYPLAVKMMYNYHTESHTDRILSAMDKETIPAQSHLSLSFSEGTCPLDEKKKLPPHPNIVAMHGVFVDQVPDLPEGNDIYPSALPPRLNKDGGFGRNATMFLVMKKYTMTLNEYLENHAVSTHTRCLLLAQLLEGVAHLGKHGIAHRDLKSNNVLVDLSHGMEHPALAICDFGCCLSDENYGLKLPFLTGEMNRDGNSALMAPEIKTAVPGPDSILDYTKADLWAAGALAYEIFGAVNPFYGYLDARHYSEEDLPVLPDDTPEAVVELVRQILRRDPSQRPIPAVAATVMQLLLWAPSHLQPFAKDHAIGCSALWKCKELCHWLEHLTLETVCQRVFGGKASLELRVKTSFLSRISRQDVLASAAFEG